MVVVADGRYAQPGSEHIDAAELATIRSLEVVEACARLGVHGDDLVQLGYEDTHVASRESELVVQLEAILRSCRPQEVLVVSRFDHHPDHRSVNRAASSALARWNEPVLVSEFPVWSWIDGPWLEQRTRSPLGRAGHLMVQPLRTFQGGRATRVSTEGFIAAKRAALAAHASQTTPYTDEEGWAVMDESMLEPFLGVAEVFLSVDPSQQEDPGC